MVLVSPAEPRSLIALLREELSELLRTHRCVEDTGADFLFMAHGERVAVQRKTFPNDFIASCMDGRLQREVNLLVKCPTRILLLEGSPFVGDGWNVASRGRNWNQVQLDNLLRSVQLYGIRLQWTPDLEGSAKAVAQMVSYYRKPTHQALLSRPKTKTQTSGTVNVNEAQCLFMFQGLPGIGSIRAKALYDAGIRLRFDCAKDDLRAIVGIGKKTAEELWKFLRRL